MEWTLPLTLILETFLNSRLYQDRALKTSRQPLEGKLLQIHISGALPPMQIVFGVDRLHVFSDLTRQQDAEIRLPASLIPKLKNRQNITSLIRNGELEVIGDPQIVQHFSALIENANWTFAEILAPFTGDIVAEGLHRHVENGLTFLQKGMKRQKERLTHAITEEWQLAPGRQEVEDLRQQIDTLTQKIHDLETRLKKWETL